MNSFWGSNASKQQRQSAGQSSGGNPAMASSPQHPILTSEAVAALPPPGLSGPSSLTFSPPLHDEPSGRYLAFVASSSMMSAHHPRRLEVKNVLSAPTSGSSSSGRSSSSERQLFIMDISSLLSHHMQNSPQSKLAVPLKTNQQLSRCESSSATLPVHPLLKLHQASSNNSTIIAAGKRKIMPEIPRIKVIGSGTANENSVRASGSTTSVAGAPRSSNSKPQTTPPFPSVSLSSLIQFSWGCCSLLGRNKQASRLRLLVPVRGSLYIQDGVLDEAEPLQLVYDKSKHSPSPRRSNKANNTTNHNTTDAEDPQLSPDGRMVAFVVGGEIYIAPCGNDRNDFKHRSGFEEDTCVQITFGATDTISHGVADFIAQEEMDRYRGFWWHPDSNGILFTKLDESNVPAYRILHQDVGGGVGPPTSTLSSNSNNLSSSSDGDVANTSSDSPSTNASNNTATFEDHRYPFAGNANPIVTIGFVKIEYNSYFCREDNPSEERRDSSDDLSAVHIAHQSWERVHWYDSPREAPEYLARVNWLPDGSACAQWQNRAQNTLVLTRMDVQRGQRARTLLIERSQHWINLHHMFKPLPIAIHPEDCAGTDDGVPYLPNPLPEGSFSFFFASERTGFCHLYLYTYAPGFNGEQAVHIKSVSGSGDWMVESVVGVDMKHDVVYVMGTYDSALERHLYALPITKHKRDHPHGRDAADNHANEEVIATMHSCEASSTRQNAGSNGVRRGLKHMMNALSGKGRPSRNNGCISSANEFSGSLIEPLRLTVEAGMHNVVMDKDCRVFVDTSSDLDRPTTVQLFALLHADDDLQEASTSLRVKSQHLVTLYQSVYDEKTLTALNLAVPNPTTHGGIVQNKTMVHRLISSLPAPELISFPTSDGSETLHAALYRPDPARYGSGPYPLICAVYGGPHVQRVNRSWSQCADMRAQRLCSLGFCVVKCDNRGSSRRGLSFESAISRRLGRLEVLDQVATVRHITLRGIADPTRVGIYGWSYGGYLAAMCLCRAPDVFHVAVAGAPVTSWDGYDTHYTERYMGLPSENVSGYRESAVFDHVPNMKGKLMIVHGLIDENVHFRHTARLINRLIGAGKDYDLLIFPDERHSPRRLRDRIYMEQRISDYFVNHLRVASGGNMGSGNTNIPIRTVPGHL